MPLRTAESSPGIVRKFLMPKILRLKPTSWFLSALVIAVGLQFVLPIPNLYQPGVTAYVVGALLIASGVFVNLWTDRIFKRENVDVLPTSPTDRKLITYGPFRLTRNPMYLGMSAILFGVAIALASLPPFLLAVAFAVLMDLSYIRHEEAKLAAQYGDQFAAYRKRTRRWL